MTWPKKRDDEWTRRYDIESAESGDCEMAMLERRQALALARRKRLFASIEDDEAHNVASAAEPLENQW